MVGPWCGWAFEAAHPETPVVGAYILAQLGLFAAFRRGVPRVGFLTGVADSPQVGPLVRAAYGLFALAAFVLVHVGDFDTGGIVTVYGAAAVMLALAYRDRALDDVLVMASVLVLAVLASWHFRCSPRRMCSSLAYACRCRSASSPPLALPRPHCSAAAVSSRK